ncbi:MAG: alkaline phosphatase family protein [Candidatus Thorarchaeota archaeon]
MSRSAKVNQVIVILMDDVRSEHLFGLMDEGKLPNMAQIAQNGIVCRDCITSFPSITFPCYSNIITGAYSGYYPKEGSGIPNYHWVARTDPPSVGERVPFICNYSSGRYLRKLNTHLGNNVKTIFEQADQGNFLSSLNVVYRGSKIVIPRDFTSDLIFRNAEKAFIDPGKYFQNKEIPKVTVIYIPKTDEIMHDKGFDHPEYIHELLDCDMYLGSLIKTLKDKDYYDETAICIISDHGNYKAEKMYDLEPFFSEVGLIPYVPKKKSGDFDADMGSVGFFNFPGDSWYHHPTVKQMLSFQTSGTVSKKLNLFEVLWKIPGTKLMYYRDDENTPDHGIIHIIRRDQKSKEFKGQIEYSGHGKEQNTKYIFDIKDLFGYELHEEATKLLDNKFHNIDEWLGATYSIDFPILIDQIPRYFKNPRCCDIMISTCGEYGFGYEHGKTKNPHVYSHDIALKNSMTVPMILGGSEEVPSYKIPYCKTTDIVPTLLDLLGIKPHQSVVGKSLIH